MAEHSTITSSERWDARVGRWVALPVAAPAAAPAAVQTPAVVASAPAAAAPRQIRMYAGARPSRLAVGFGGAGNSSEDAELASSLPMLRARARQMVRESAYAKRAKLVVVNNVIGGGVGMQAQIMRKRYAPARDELDQNLNDEIETLHSDWCAAQCCHTGGVLHFHDLERQAMGQVFEAGEILLRWHPVALGDCPVPLALEVIESERLPCDFEAFNAGAALNGNAVRMGVEVDRFHRPVAYYIRTRHPGDVRRDVGRDEFERVPAEQIFHLRIVDRWPQTRGVPWLHSTLLKIESMNEYSAAEVQAARFSSYYFGTMETAEANSPIAAQPDPAQQPTYDIEPGVIQELPPGTKLAFHTPNRPSTALDPFMRYMLREVAAGTGPSYESLSRDYSQSNYSSSRLALLDDRDLWRVLQRWWIRSFREPLHRLWLQQAVLAGAIAGLPVERYAPDPRRFQAVLFKPRGWSFVDPAKEVDAYANAVANSFTTISDVIAQTAGGQDLEDILATRVREQQLFADAGLSVPQPAAAAAAPPPAPPPMPGMPDESNDDPPARVVSLRR